MKLSRLWKCASDSHSRVIFSGIQPTGIPHLGNYFGFVAPFVDIQQSEAPATKLYLSVVDLHAISLGPVPAEQLRSNTLKMATALIACGVDPQRCLLFRQSDVPEITQLSWILGSLQTVTKLQRLPQYKDKMSKFSRGEVPVGLLTYPLLQAADVLTFKGTVVPVGEDQSQHMNLLSGLAYAFNKTYKEDFFPIPKQMTRKVHARVKSLRHPESKMSKSEASAKGRIDLTDSREMILEKCKKAMTDSVNPHVTHDPVQRPGVSNLIDLYAAVSGVSLEEVISETKDWTVAELKVKLGERIDERISPIRERYEQLMSKPNIVEDLLQHNGTVAREEAVKTLEGVKRLTGFA